MQDVNNRGLTTLPPSASVDDVVAILMRDGGVIVEDMISSETLGQFFADIDPYLERTPFGEDGFAGSRTQRLGALFAKSLSMADFIQQPHFMGAAEKILGDDFDFVMGGEQSTAKTTIQVNSTQIIQISPGEGLQLLHRDDLIHHNRHPGFGETLVQVLYAGSDFTAENGATRVVPGSHLWADGREPTLEETVPAVMKKGSGLIYIGSVFHGGGQNTTTDELRTAIYMSFTKGYLRQEENQYLVVPLDTVRKYSEKVQDLIGYKLCPPYCGFVEMQEPSIVLHQEDYSVGKAQNILV